MKLTESNKVELQKWVLKFDSKKKEKIPLKSSKVVVHKTKETPLAKTQLKTIDNVTEPNFPPSKDCKWRNPPWKMKGVLKKPTQEKDSVNPSVTNKPNEQFLHEAEDKIISKLLHSLTLNCLFISWERLILFSQIITFLILVMLKFGAVFYITSNIRTS